MGTQVHATLTEEQVSAISDRLDEPEWVLERRLSALEALETAEMPDVIRTPGRTWTNLTDLDFTALVDPREAAADQDRVGPEGVEVLDWSTALADHEELVRDRFGSVIDPERNYLTALSTALFSSGTVVYVPAGVAAEDVTIRTTMHTRSLFNYTLVVTERSAEVTILERQATGERPTASDPATTGTAPDRPDATADPPGEAAPADRYYGGIVEIDVGENAHVHYGSLQNLDTDTYHYTLKRAATAPYGTVDLVEANVGSRLTKSSIEVSLDGEGAETKMVGTFFGHGDQHFDLDTRVWHRAEHTTADLVTRGVVDDDARSVYEGVQNVGEAAWDTSSYQRENTLMLSDESEADASPKLIINNHDTEASHSATVGQVDREDLLYMLTRGVGEQEATDMMVEGFFVPVLEEIAVDELREDLRDLIRARLDSRR